MAPVRARFEDDGQRLLLLNLTRAMRTDGFTGERDIFDNGSSDPPKMEAKNGSSIFFDILDEGLKWPSISHRSQRPRSALSHPLLGVEINTNLSQGMQLSHATRRL